MGPQIGSYAHLKASLGNRRVHALLETGSNVDELLPIIHYFEKKIITGRYSNFEFYIII